MANATSTITDSSIRVGEDQLLDAALGREPLGEVPRRRRGVGARGDGRALRVDGRCSTSPPPPSISTIAPTKSAVDGRVDGRRPSPSAGDGRPPASTDWPAPASSVTRASSGRPPALTMTTSPPVPSSPDGRDTGAEPRLLVNPPGTGTDGIHGALIARTPAGSARRRRGRRRRAPASGGDDEDEDREAAPVHGCRPLALGPEPLVGEPLLDPSDSDRSSPSTADTSSARRRRGPRRRGRSASRRPGGGPQPGRDPDAARGDQGGDPQHAEHDQPRRPARRRLVPQLRRARRPRRRTPSSTPKPRAPGDRLAVHLELPRLVERRRRGGRRRLDRRRRRGGSRRRRRTPASAPDVSTPTSSSGVDAARPRRARPSRRRRRRDRGPVLEDGDARRAERGARSSWIPSASISPAGHRQRLGGGRVGCRRRAARRCSGCRTAPAAGRRGAWTRRICSTARGERGRRPPASGAASGRARRAGRRRRRHRHAVGDVVRPARAAHADRRCSSTRSSPSSGSAAAGSRPRRRAVVSSSDHEPSVIVSTAGNDADGDRHTGEHARPAGASRTSAPATSRSNAADGRRGADARGRARPARAARRPRGPARRARRDPAARRARRTPRRGRRRGPPT